MVNQAMFAEIASGRTKLTQTEMRVWSALVAEADVGNYVRQRQGWLAEQYQIPKQHFSKALASLRKKDMVIRLRDKGTGTHLMLSPFHFWKGAANLHKRGMMTYRHLASAQPGLETVEGGMS